MALGAVYLWQKQYQRAVAEMERGVTLDPNEANGYAGLAMVLSCVGRSEEAVGMAEQALRLKPRGMSAIYPTSAAPMPRQGDLRKRLPS
jgi:Flp pilus assembly protein TadD